MKYVICFDRQISEQCEIIVDAASEQEAEDKARETLDDLINEGDDVWEPTDYIGKYMLVYCAATE